jgi:hypothetical protein
MFLEYYFDVKDLVTIRTGRLISGRHMPQVIPLLSTFSTDKTEKTEDSPLRGGAFAGCPSSIQIDRAMY